MRCVNKLLAVAAMAAIPAGVAQALPINVADFSVDPSGPQFTIQPVSASDPGSINLVGDPTLQYGVSSVPDGTPNTMKMSWEQNVSDMEAQAGWELVFGLDPDIRNQQIILSINPPGGWTNAAGIPIPSPGNPNPPVNDLFQGIRSLQVRAIDNVGALAGGWGFNTDMSLLMPPGNDFLAAGGVSLQNNFMQTVTINVGNGPAAGSAVVAGGPGGPYIGPNFLVGGNGNFANISKLQFFENGILQGGVQVIPGQLLPGIANYWDHIAVTPEPATGSLLALAGLALLRRRRT